MKNFIHFLHVHKFMCLLQLNILKLYQINVAHHCIYVNIYMYGPANYLSRYSLFLSFQFLSLIMFVIL